MKQNPRPIGYTEVQRSWVGSANPDMSVLMLNDVYGVMDRDQPNMKPYGSRVEMVFDGAGVEHYNLYVGFVPRELSETPTTPPLDPRNLNDSPAPKIGDATPELALPPGWKEQKFARGT